RLRPLRRLGHAWRHRRPCRRTHPRTRSRARPPPHLRLGQSRAQLRQLHARRHPHPRHQPRRRRRPHPRRNRGPPPGARHHGHPPRRRARQPTLVGGPALAPRPARIAPHPLAVSTHRRRRALRNILRRHHSTRQI